MCDLGLVEQGNMCYTATVIASQETVMECFCFLDFKAGPTYNRKYFMLYIKNKGTVAENKRGFIAG